jgi:outer membrane protein assembly factor BamB
MCFDRSSGKLLWQSGIDVTESEPSHPTNPYCSASPVTDGEYLLVSFGAAGLYGYDFDGKELWHRDLGPQKHIWGNAASPVLYRDLVILNFGPGERTFLIAVDKKTGKTIWQVDEPGGDSGEKKPGQEKEIWVGSWTTPTIVRVDDHDELLMSFPSRVASLDPMTGKERWTCRGLNPLVYTSPLYSDGVVVAMGGFGGSSLAVKTGGNGDVTETHRLWQVPKNKQRIGSGVISGDHIYILDDPGIAECIALRSGKVVWEQRLTGHGAKSDNWSSMVLAGDKLYAINQSGDGFVVRASPKFEVLSTNSIGETTISSIAPSDGELFIRTYKALWCISEKH